VNLKISRHSASPTFLHGIPRDFFGRKVEISEIYKILTCLHGQKGIGKSETAKYVARHAADRAKRIFYLNLRVDDQISEVTYGYLIWNYLSRNDLVGEKSACRSMKIFSEKDAEILKPSRKL
jgi:hypothetical protein